jgi:predicted DsbA family dithiol-disulfide isomerase
MLERELAGRVTFERRAFLLVARDGQRPAYDEYVVAHRVRAAQLEPALGFAIPKVGQPYPRSSWPSQLLALRVREQHPDKLDALEDALFAAMFRELQDISSTEVLKGCARAAGVPDGEVDEALADPVLREIAMREHREAQEAGVDGIPALVVDGYAPVVGAIPLEALRRSLLAALSDENPAGDGPLG